MNAPPIEVVLRLATAVLSSFSAYLIVLTIVRARRGQYRVWMTPIPLLWFLCGVMVVTAIWRWFVFWLGFQTDIGHFAYLVQWIQPMNAAMLFLLYLAITLIIYWHSTSPHHKGGVAYDAGP